MPNQVPDSGISSLPASAEPIVAAALGLFSEHGFDGVSMRQIAEKAKVSKANLYHHFENKHELYLAAMRSAVESSHWLITKAGSSDESLTDRLGSFMSSQLQCMLDDPAPHRMVQREILGLGVVDPEAMAESVLGGFYRDVLAVLNQEQQAGKLAPGLEPRDVTALIASATLMYFQLHAVLQFVPGSGFDRTPQQYSQQMIELILQNINAASAPS